MSAQEIRQLRGKFIRVAMASFFLVMLFITAAINLFSSVVTTRMIRSNLAAIARSEGQIDTDDRDAADSRGYPSFIEAFTPTFRHNHFFILTYDADGEQTRVITESKNTQELETVQQYASLILQAGRDFGRFGMYYYRLDEADGTRTLTLLDCTGEITNKVRLLAASIGFGLLALLITLLLVLRFSDKAIEPEIENSVRQRQFITNASHELKTPLAVIRANTELLELTGGENEWTQSTLKQVDHLNGLIQNLVMITRAQEREDRSQLSVIDASTAVNETVEPYEALARQSGKTLQRAIEPDLHMTADESKLRQLTTILVDNAIKYCDEGGAVRVGLEKLRRGVRLTVSNDYAAGEHTDCSRFFDRFYREDAAHNIDAGGYGIGLSIAEGICRQAGGTIRAAWKDGVISFLCTLP